MHAGSQALMGVRHLLWLIHRMMYTENVFWGMNVGFCIDGHLLSHKEKVNPKRHLYTKTIMIINSLRCRELWNQWNKCMELRERGNKKENERPSGKLHTVKCEGRGNKNV
jgi:hypothetical protein